MTEDLDGETFVGDKHSRWWGYGFSYCYTKALLNVAAFVATGFGEDYSLVCDAHAAGARCRAFVDSTADPTCLHVLHSRSSSRTIAGRHVLAADGVSARYGREILRLTGTDPRDAATAFFARISYRAPAARRGGGGGDDDDDDAQ